MKLIGAGAAGLAMGTSLRATRGSAALADAYELIDIGLTSPSVDIGLGFNDMNASGVVVGNMFIDAEKNSPWIFTGGKLTRVKTGKYGARLSCINDNGVIGGRELLGWHSSDNPWGRPVLWVDGEKQVLPYPEGLPSPAEQGGIRDINNDGVAVGSVSIAGGDTFPVVWRNGIPELLLPPDVGSRGVATDINNAGTILGDTNQAEFEGGGFYRDGSGAQPMSYDGLTGVTQLFYSNLDEAGRVLGYAVYNGESLATIQASPTSPPEFLPKVREDQTYSVTNCSDGGTLIGGAMTVDAKNHAVVWNDGEPIELRNLVKNGRGLRLTDVYSITPDGALAGNAVDGDGGLHAYQLVPAS